MSGTPSTMSSDYPQDTQITVADGRTRFASVWNRVITVLIELPAVLAILALMVHITLNALSRSFFNHPVPNTLEVSQYWYMPLIVLLGFVAAQHRNQHVAADVLFELLPKSTRRYVLSFAMVAATVVSAGFTWFSAEEAMHQASIRATAGTSSLPSWPVQFVVPVVTALLTLQFAAATIRALRTKEFVQLDELEVVAAAQDFGNDEEAKK